MNVLSLFDGMRCCAMALQRSNIKIDNYYSSEIDKHANKAGRIVYPQAVELGDVTKWRAWDIDWSSIDLVAGGSPCQGFSFAGKQLAFDDPRSKLFFVFVDILNHIKSINPRVKFLLENVRMKKEYIAVISKYMGVEPIPLNSNLVSAQNRYRLYWTNIEDVKQPKDKGVMLKDIVHERVDIKYNAGHDLIIGYKGGDQLNPTYKSQANTIHPREGKVGTLCAGTHGYSNGYVMSESWCEWWKKKAEYQLKKKYSSLDADKAVTIIARQYANWNGNFIMEGLTEYIVPFAKTLKILDKEVKKGKVGYFRKDSAGNRVYYIHDKACTLMGNAGGGAAKMGQYLFGKVTKNYIQRYPTDKVTTSQASRSQFIDGDRKSSTVHTRCDQMEVLIGGILDLKDSHLFGCISPDRIDKRQNGQRFNKGQKFYTLTAQDRHGVLVEGYIRKLTPIECGRLQTVDDQVIIDILDTGVSQSQVYKCLGNGWTVDIISHIFNNLEQEHKMPNNEDNIKDLTVNTEVYENKELNCELAIKDRMKQRNADPKSTGKKVVNGVTMPTRKSDAKRVWEISNYLSELAQAPAAKEDVWAMCQREGITITTTKRNHSQWRKYYGADGTPVSHTESQAGSQETPSEPSPEETVVTAQIGISTEISNFAPSQGESFLVSKDKEPGGIKTNPLLSTPSQDAEHNTVKSDTSSNPEKLEQGMPTAPPSMVANKETPEWMKAPAQEVVPNVEAPPNGWGVEKAEEVPEPSEHPIVTEAIKALNTFGTVVPSQSEKGVATTEACALRSRVNHILAMGKINVYTTQNLSDVSTVIMEFIRDNPSEVREYLDANS